METRDRDIVKVSIEEKLTEIVSGFGRYQIWQSVLAILPVICTAMSNTNFVFAAASGNYRCAVPECGSSNVSFLSTLSNLTNDRCYRPLFHHDSCSPENFDKEISCNKWIYEDKNSFVAEFDLACQEWKRTLVGTIHNLGVLVAMPLMGFVSDCWGRRTAIMISSLSLCVGAFKTLVTTGPAGYLQYVLIEFIEALLVTGTYTTCFVLIVEIIGSDKRIIGAAAVGSSVAIGELILDFIVWNVPYWRKFFLIIYCPAPIFIIYVYILEESMRWLLTTGRKDKALVVLQKIATWNKFAITCNVIDEVNKETLEITQGTASTTEKFTIKLLVSSPILLKRVIVCSWWWFTAAFVYYGLMINSVSLPGNKYANFALTSFVTIPGDIIAVITLDRIGRRKTLLGGFLFCGVCCVGIGFIPTDHKIASVAMFLVGKLSISACFNSVYVYTSELVPTSARGSLVGICSMVARVGTVLAPLTPLLSDFWRSFPTLIFGVTSLTAAMLTLATPETLRRRLPNTIAEAAAMS
ncbi:organic cation transporter protein-like isoform X1 [Danaus plexippus]|uniref:organic cation transporter protein-like isoform X1 n=1 Tax=Danaus plexippus TaxID=13037 RepID=UPI002AB01B20|nr:organic cation transporter protein-like isoform X1 [Danaus plexippus]